MGPLAAAIYGASIPVGRHETTPTHVTGLSIRGSVALTLVVAALALGSVSRRGRHRRRAASGRTT